MITKYKITQFLEGRLQITKMRTDINYTFKVEDIDKEGNYWVKITYDSIYFEQDGPMGKIEYNSSNPPKNIHPLALPFSLLKEQSFRMKLTPKGDIKEIEGVNAMITRMVEALGIPEETEKTSFERTFKEHFGEQAIRETFQKVTAVYPREAVGINDSWSACLALTKGFPMIIQSEYIFKSYKDETAYIEVHSKVKPNLEAPPLKIGSVIMRYNFYGEMDGTVVLDVPTGWVDSLELTHKSSGRIEIKDTLSPSQSLSWPITVEGTFILKSQK